jgi:hypothetical protein
MLGASFNHVSKIALSITAPTSSDDDKEKSDSVEKHSEEVNKYHQNVMRIDNIPKSTTLVENSSGIGMGKYLSFRFFHTGEFPPSSVDEAYSIIGSDNSRIFSAEARDFKLSSSIYLHPCKNEQPGTNTNINTNNRLLTSNGKSWNNVVGLVKKQNVTRNLTTNETDEKQHNKFGSPFHALVKSMRAKQKQRELFF